MFAGCADGGRRRCCAEYGESVGVGLPARPTTCSTSPATSAESGKTPGTDLREGVPTLPVLQLRRMAAAGPLDADGDRLLALTSGPIEGDAEHAEALALLRAHPALEAARAELRRHAEDARALLADLPDIPARAALAAVCDAVVARHS